MKVNLTEREEALASHRRYLARQILEVLYANCLDIEHVEKLPYRAMEITDQLYEWSVRKTIEEER